MVDSIAFTTRRFFITLILSTLVACGGGGGGSAVGGGSAPWTATNPDNVGISRAIGNQYYPEITPDGAGGAIITWEDYRNGTADLYAQRVNANGVVQWAADGVAISAAAGDQQFPKISSDGAGGAIITWQDQRSGAWDLYAQRVNASGVVQWAADGVPISTAVGDQRNPEIAADGAGGALITWRDQRSGNYDIYAQQVDASGVVQWTADGVSVGAAVGDQITPQVIPDGAGGAIITWQDQRSGAWDLYAQRVNASGVVQWAADGVPISNAAGDQFLPLIASDGAGGAIITWEDYRTGTADIYAQRVNASGVVQWTADGVGISIPAGDQIQPQIIADGAGGAFISWQDQRSGAWDLYAQRVNASGVAQWAADGATISTAVGAQRHPQIALGISGGAIIAWDDTRSGNIDIYAQGITAGGIQ